VDNDRPKSTRKKAFGEKQKKKKGVGPRKLRKRGQRPPPKDVSVEGGPKKAAKLKYAEKLYSEI